MELYLMKTKPLMQTNSETIPDLLLRPAIIATPDKLQKASPGDKFADLWALITRGESVLLTGTYGFAMSFYSWLKKRILTDYPVHNYEQARIYREIWHTYSQRVLVGVKDHKVELSKSVENPWLKLFYPDNANFLITWPDYLGLNGARQWYEKGIQYPMLAHRIHPFYGTYFPTRNEHLLLFDKWLKTTTKPEKALDIGTGCGVISFILHAHGVRNIHATDINPNAIFSLNQELEKLGEPYKQSIYPIQKSFFGGFKASVNDLVVFNPPWIPGKAEKSMDQACYFDGGFFDAFFRQADTQCETGAQIVLLFSDYAVVSRQTDTHPLTTAISSHSHIIDLIDHISEPVKQKPAKKKSWLDDIRSREHIELFVLRKK